MVTMKAQSLLSPEPLANSVLLPCSPTLPALGCPVNRTLHCPEHRTRLLPVAQPAGTHPPESGAPSFHCRLVSYVIGLSIHSPVTGHSDALINSQDVVWVSAHKYFHFYAVTGFLAKGEAWVCRICLTMLHYSHTLTISDPTPGMGPVVHSYQNASNGGCF